MNLRAASARRPGRQLRHAVLDRIEIGLLTQLDLLSRFQLSDGDAWVGECGAHLLAAQAELVAPVGMGRDDLAMGSRARRRGRLMPRSREPAMYGIRANAGGTAWRVELVRRGVTMRRRFSAAGYGDAAHALAAAQAWRDATSLQTPAQTLQQAGQYLRPNNSSGHPGVHRIERRKKLQGRNTKTYVLWMARSPEGVRPALSRSCAVSRYGEKEAYALAVAAREGFVQLLQGYLLPSVPRALHPSPYLASELGHRDGRSPAAHRLEGQGRSLCTYGRSEVGAPRALGTI